MTCGPKQGRACRRRSGRSCRTALEVYRESYTSCPPDSPQDQSAGVFSGAKPSDEAAGESHSRTPDTPDTTSQLSFWCRCRRHRERLLVWRPGSCFVRLTFWTESPSQIWKCWLAGQASYRRILCTRGTDSWCCCPSAAGCSFCRSCVHTAKWLEHWTHPDRCRREAGPQSADSWQPTWWLSKTNKLKHHITALSSILNWYYT